MLNATRRFSLKIGGVASVAPSNVDPPEIGGGEDVGAILSMTLPGVWSGIPAPTKTYQWRINSDDASGQTDPNEFNSAGLAEGDSVTLREFATNTAGSAYVDSDPIVLDAPTSPLFVSADSIAHVGTTWTKPTDATTGRLLVGIRHNTSASEVGLGSSFTPIGTTGSALPRDVWAGYRIIEEGDGDFTMPSGGNGITYSIWEAGTFDPADPCPPSLWSAANAAAHVDISLAALSVPFGIGIYGGVATAAIFPGDIGGATQNSEKNTGAAPYAREWRRAGGWSAETIPDPGGTSGQFMTVYSFGIRPLVT